MGSNIANHWSLVQADQPKLMSTPPANLRARSPEQKEARRRHLLDIAKTLLMETSDLHDMGINELARRARMTKSNVYRYFESSEAVMLDVLVEEFILWRGDLRKALSYGGKHLGTIEHIAQAFSGTFAARPRLCRLASLFPSILERNVSAERMVGFKHGLLAVHKETALDFHRCLPSISIREFEQFIHHALALLVGLWPLSHPAKVAIKVGVRPEFEALGYDYQRDLEQGLLMLLHGITGRQ